MDCCLRRVALHSNFIEKDSALAGRVFLQWGPLVHTTILGGCFALLRPDYWQVSLSRAARAKTAFATHSGFVPVPGDAVVKFDVDI